MSKQVYDARMEYVRMMAFERAAKGPQSCTCDLSYVIDNLVT